MGKQIWYVLLWLPVLVICHAASSQAATTCGGNPGPSGTIELKLGAAMRQFVVRLPANYGARTPGPLVFLFHPGGMNVQYMQGLVPLPRVWLDAMAVYPQGLPRAAAGFRAGWQTRTGDLDDQDLTFFDAMLEWLRANHCFDEKRVFALGYSNGAQLASVLACERSGAIAGVAIASGSLACTPREPRPIIFSHGTRDPVIPYERALDAARVWASQNACGAPPKSAGSGCVAADSCSAAPVVLCTYEGGHEYNDSFTRAAVEFLKAAHQP